MAGTINVGKTRKFIVERCERQSAWDRLVKVSFVGHHVCCNEMFHITVTQYEAWLCHLPLDNVNL
jgi:hypothetical protein